MDSLISQTKALSWKDLKLELAVEEAKTKSELALVGRLVATRPLNKFVIHESIKAAWSFIQKFLIEDLEANLFLFTFQSPQDKQRIINQAPWSFKGHLLILKPWPLGSTLQEICLNHQAFHIQIHGLRLDHMTQENAT